MPTPGHASEGSRGRRLGVFCLEGNWDPNLESRRSVRSLLTFLEDVGSIRLIRRDIGTPSELEYYLDRWQSYPSYGLLYLALHGDRGELDLGDGIDIDALAESLDGTCKGRLVHLSSCSTLRVPDGRLREFKKRSGALHVSGYRRDVGFVESAILDLALIESIAQHPDRPGFAYRQIDKDHAVLVDRLGFMHA